MVMLNEMYKYIDERRKQHIDTHTQLTIVAASAENAPKIAALALDFTALRLIVVVAVEDDGFQARDTELKCHRDRTNPRTFILRERAGVGEKKKER